MTTEVARQRLETAIIVWSSRSEIDRLRDGGEYLQPYIDAFASAVRAEALAQRDQSPELAEAEVQLRGVNWTGPSKLFGNERKAIAAELDRLRAREKLLEGEIAELRKLCERSIRHVCLPDVPPGEQEQFNKLVIDLAEAAAKGAGK